LEAEACAVKLARRGGLPFDALAVQVSKQAEETCTVPVLVQVTVPTVAVIVQVKVPDKV
jgi:hypothetical protein